MTRKRFVRMLMSLGESRNDAVRLTQFVHDYGSYELYFRDLTGQDIPAVVLQSIGVATEDLLNAFEEMSRTIGKVALAVSCGINAFVNEYSSCMKRLEEETSDV